MPRVRVGDVELNYEKQGAGFPLVLLHAYPTDHAIWQLQMPAFAEQYETIAVDLRGFGRSDKPPGSNTPRVMSEDIVGLLDGLGFARAAVCGISLGGIVAAQLTLDHPRRVTAAIWVGASSHGYGDEKWQGGGDWLTGSGDGLLTVVDVYSGLLSTEGYLGLWNRLWKPNLNMIVGPAVNESMLGSYLVRSLFEERYVHLNADVRPLISVLDGLRTWSIVDRLSHVYSPVQIVVGEHDPTLPGCEEVAAFVPGAEFVLVPDSGHFVNLAQPGVFNCAVLDFLHRAIPFQQLGVTSPRR